MIPAAVNDDSNIIIVTEREPEVIVTIADGPGADGVSIASVTSLYALTRSGSEIPESGWSTEIPSLQQGWFLWTQVRVALSNGQTNISYSAAYSGVDGEGGGGSVRSVNGVGPDEFGNIRLYQVDDGILVFA